MKLSILLLLVCATSMLLSARAAPHDIIKRSDDPTPLETIVMQHSADLSNLKALTSVLQAQLETKDRHVAFLAQFSQDHVSAPASGPYIFDRVVFNHGNGYDAATGTFTAPVAGVYTFSAQFFTDVAQPERPLLDVKVNGNTQVRMAFESDPHLQATGEESDSTTFTVSLNSGDRVWITATHTQIYKFWGAFHTFFTGALLYSV